MSGYDVRVDWDNDGSFEGPGEQVADRTLARRSPVQIQYGRDQERALSPTASGRLAGLEIDNTSRDYSPDNATSPLVGDILPGRGLWVGRWDRMNLVPNPSFEVDPVGWSSSANRVSPLTRTTAQFQFGVASLNGVIASVAGTPTVDSVLFPVVAGRTYTVSAYGRSAAVGSRSTGVKMIFLRVDGSITLNPSVTATSSDSGVWTRRSSTNTAPSDATQATVVVFYALADAVVGDVHQIDGVMVEESASLGTYFDGSTGGGAFWRTTPHNSASIIGQVLFRGFVDDFQLHPERDSRSVTLTGLDALVKLKDAAISTALFGNIGTGAAVGHVLDAIGWPAADRDLDSGSTIMPWWWEEGTDAYAAIERLVHSEGPPALVYVDGAGKFVFRDRHHRVTDAASITSQKTFRDTGTEPEFSAPLGYDMGWRDVINDVTFTVPNTRPNTGSQVIYTQDDPFVVAASSTITLAFKTDEPWIAATVAADATDSLTVTLSRTQAQSAIISLQNTNAFAVTVSEVRVTARLVISTRTTQVALSDAASIDTYGKRTWPNEAPWANLADALAIADIIITTRKDRLPAVQLRIVANPNVNKTRFDAGIQRRISDRITIIDAETGLNSDFFVEQISHTISEAGLFHETVLGCEKIPAAPPDVPSSVFILNSATNGVLNTSLLGH